MSSDSGEENGISSPSKFNFDVGDGLSQEQTLTLERLLQKHQK